MCYWLKGKRMCVTGDVLQLEKVCNDKVGWGDALRVARWAWKCIQDFLANNWIWTPLLYISASWEGPPGAQEYGTKENWRETFFYLQGFMPKAWLVFSQLCSNLQSKHGIHNSHVFWVRIAVCVLQSLNLVLSFRYFISLLQLCISDSMHLCLCSFASILWRFPKWLPAVHVSHIISWLKTKLFFFWSPNNVWILIKNISPEMSVLRWLSSLRYRVVTKINRPWC